MTFQPRFMESMLKVQRAKRHLAEINAIIDGYLQTDFCRLGIRQDAVQEVIYVEAVQDLPIDVSLAIGDCIHNLRAALDYMSSKIVNEAGINSGRTTFPSHATRRELEASFRVADPNAAECPTCGRTRGRAGENSVLKRADPEVERLILDVVKPYDAGEGATESGRAVWAIGKLDNISKHRNIVPTVTIAGIRDFCVELHNGGRIEENYVAVVAGAARPFDMVGIKGTTGAKITDYGKADVSIVFPANVPFAGKPIVPTLLQLSRLTRGVISRFEAHYR